MQNSCKLFQIIDQERKKFKIQEYLPCSIAVKPKKLTYVDELLKKHFDENWSESEDLTYNKNIVSRTTIEGNIQEG